MQRNRFVPVVIVLSCICIFGCGRPKLNSRWRNHEVIIDGKFDDWQNDAAYYDEKTKVHIWVVNDNRYLYVCLVSRNRSLSEQALRLGLTVWFDPLGGTNKAFGIRFPLGMQNEDMSLRDGRGPRRHPDEEGAGRSDKMGLRKMPDMLREIGGEIEVIGPQKEKRHTMAIDAAEKSGISVRIGEFRGCFVYELKVPIVKDGSHLYATGMDKNGLIGIGFETSSSSPVAMQGMEASGAGGGPGGGMMPGGGMPGGGMGMPGPGNGIPRGMGKGAGTEKVFRLWTMVILSSGGET